MVLYTRGHHSPLDQAPKQQYISPFTRSNPYFNHRYLKKKKWRFWLTLCNLHAEEMFNFILIFNINSTFFNFGQVIEQWTKPIVLDTVYYIYSQYKIEFISDKPKKIQQKNFSYFDFFIIIYNSSI